MSFGYGYEENVEYNFEEEEEGYGDIDEFIDDNNDDGFITVVEGGDDEFGAFARDYESQVEEAIGHLLEKLDAELYGELESSNKEVSEWAQAFPYLRVVGRPVVMHQRMSNNESEEPPTEDEIFAIHESGQDGRA